MNEDSELLRRYSEAAAEAAFAAVVQRHIDFVYACALRRVGGDTHLAEDVTQQVFATLARQAAAVARRETLSGWLYTTTRNVSAQLVRTERRRQARESTAVLMHDLHSTHPQDAEWTALRPVLDDAMDDMSDEDRQAVFLRYFEGQSYADIGARLRLTANTARMRVDRALEKLRTGLARRGVTSTTTGLAVALANHATVAAPAGLAASVTSTALSLTATGAAGWAGGWFGVSTMQATLAGALTLAGATAYITQDRTNTLLSDEVAAMHAQRQTLPALRAENRQLAAAAAEVAALRRDDAEFQQLAVRVAELKQVRQERARLAQARAQDRRGQIEDWVREQDRLAQAEVERLNKEGNALVVEFKRISAQAKDGALPAETRAQASVAAKAKLEEIQTKQREVREYIAESRRRLTEPLAELRRIEAGSGPSEPPGAHVARESGELAQRAAEVDRRRAMRAAPSSGGPPEASPQGTLKLAP